MTNEELVRLIQSGEQPDVMEQLYRQNEGYIKALANKYSGYAELDDLMQEGFFGLYQAVQHYETGHETAFLTYATYWIKQAMRRYVARCSSSIRLPEDMAQAVLRYRRFVSQYCQYYGERPSRDDIRRYLGMGAESFNRIEKAANQTQIQSLDEPLKMDDELSLADTVDSGEDMAGDVIESVMHQELKAELWPLVDALEGKQPFVLRRRYEDNMTRTEVSELLGVTCEAVRQQEVKGLRALRLPRNAARLRPFLTEPEEVLAYRQVGVQAFNRTWTSSTEKAALYRAGEI